MGVGSIVNAEVGSTSGLRWWSRSSHNGAKRETFELPVSFQSACQSSVNLSAGAASLHLLNPKASSAAAHKTVRLLARSSALASFAATAQALLPGGHVQARQSPMHVARQV